MAGPRKPLRTDDRNDKKNSRRCLPKRLKKPHGLITVKKKAQDGKNVNKMKGIVMSDDKKDRDKPSPTGDFGESDRNKKMGQKGAPIVIDVEDSVMADDDAECEKNKRSGNKSSPIEIDMENASIDADGEPVDTENGEKNAPIVID